MNKLTHSPGWLLALTFASLSLAGAGCASTGASSTPSGPVDINGARYKLLAAGGALDGRVVEFMVGGDSARGCLAATGNKLRGVSGIDLGTWVYSLQKKGPSEWEGVYRAIGADGSITDKPVSVSFQGDSLSWNLESATWERQSDKDGLTPEEKQKCKSK